MKGALLEAQQEVESARARADELQAALETAQAEIVRLLGELEGARTSSAQGGEGEEEDELAALLRAQQEQEAESARARADELQAALGAAQAEIARLQGELESVRVSAQGGDEGDELAALLRAQQEQEVGAVRAEVEAVRGEIESFRARAETAEREVGVLSELLQRQQQTDERLGEDGAALQAAADAARQEAGALRAQLERAQAEAGALRGQLALARAAPPPSPVQRPEAGEEEGQPREGQEGGEDLAAELACARADAEVLRAELRLQATALDGARAAHEKSLTEYAARLVSVEAQLQNALAQVSLPPPHSGAAELRHAQVGVVGCDLALVFVVGDVSNRHCRHCRRN